MNNRDEILGQVVALLIAKPIEAACYDSLVYVAGLPFDRTDVGYTVYDSRCESLVAHERINVVALV
jgi:hypothetical protein